MIGTKREKRGIDMLNGPLYSSLIRYTVPIILTTSLQLLFNAADLMVVGQFRSKLSVAAVGATGSITHLFVNLFVGLSVGVSMAVAVALGARNDENVRRAVHTAVPLAVIAGAILTALGIMSADICLGWLGTPEEIRDLAALYMKIYFVGMIPSMLYNFGSAILRAAGDTKGPLVYLTTSGVINVILNVIFVAGCGMDVDGVAWATSISQAIAAALVLRALARRTDACRLAFRQLHIYKEQLLTIMRIGIPAGLQNSLYSIANVFIQSAFNSFNSVDLLSGNSAAVNIDGFIYATASSFQQAALNFTGQNVGAGNRPRVRKIFRACTVCSIVSTVAVSALVILFGRPLLGLYVPGEPAAIEFGMLRLWIVCLPYFLDGLVETTAGCVRGLGHSVAPMLVSVFGICVFRVLMVEAVILPFFKDVRLLYLVFPVSWLLAYIGDLILYLRYVGKKPERKHLYKKKPTEATVK